MPLKQVSYTLKNMSDAQKQLAYALKKFPYALKHVSYILTLIYKDRCLRTEISVIRTKMGDNRSEIDVIRNISHALK